MKKGLSVKQSSTTVQSGVNSRIITRKAEDGVAKNAKTETLTTHNRSTNNYTATIKYH